MQGEMMDVILDVLKLMILTNFKCSLNNFLSIYLYVQPSISLPRKGAL